MFRLPGQKVDLTGNGPSSPSTDKGTTSVGGGGGGGSASEGGSRKGKGKGKAPVSILQGLDLYSAPAFRPSSPSA